MRTIAINNSSFCPLSGNPSTRAADRKRRRRNTAAALPGSGYPSDVTAPGGWRCRSARCRRRRRAHIAHLESACAGIYTPTRLQETIPLPLGSRRNIISVSTDSCSKTSTSQDRFAALWRSLVLTESGSLPDMEPRGKPTHTMMNTALVMEKEMFLSYKCLVFKF